METDPDDGLICIQNGLLNWRTGELLPHDPNRLTTIQLPIKYEPNAGCPYTRKFFSEVLPKDAIPVAEEVFGYVIIPVHPF